MYPVGRLGHDGYMERALGAWGVDGHNSHTNVCSSSARFGYQVWCGADRPSPDYANARFILLISSHLETGHYFNPQAQRIIEGKVKGARLAGIGARRPQNANHVGYPLPPLAGGGEGRRVGERARDPGWEGHYPGEHGRRGERG